MPKATRAAAGLVERIVRMMALAGGLVLMGLMGLIVYSVLMRRLFNAPPLGVYDMAEVALIPVAFFAFAYTGVTRGHIAVDLISAIARREVVRWSDAIIYSICAVFVGVLTWQCVLLMLHAIEIDEVTQMIEIPYYPFIMIMVLGSAMFTVVLAMQAYRAMRNREEPDYSE